jgi:hypothetical protein
MSMSDNLVKSLLGGNQTSKADELFQQQINELLVAIQGSIEQENSEFSDLVNMLKNKIENGDARSVVLEQFVRSIELKSTKSDKLIKLMDTIAKVRKGSGVNINIGLNTENPIEELSPEERLNIIKNL